MIPNQWYPIVDASRLGRRPLALRRLGQDLVLWRRPDGRVVAQHDRCPHKGARLSTGKVVDGQIECPYHGFRFDSAGACVAAPCLGASGRVPDSMRLESVPVREEHRRIWLWHGDPAKVREELPILPAMLRPAPATARASYDRAVHYTRYIESLIEFYHVPWVHAGRWYNTLDHFAIAGLPERLFIGSGRRYRTSTYVQAHSCEVNGERIDATMDVAIENDPFGKFFRWNVTFLAPCLVYLETHVFRAAIYMTPNDEENTHVMFEWYEYVPLSRYLPNFMHRAINEATAILQQHGQDDQDYRVMLGQTPKASDVGVNKLVAADELNARYLQLRRRLIREASGLHAIGEEDNQRDRGARVETLGGAA
ncbi:MAG: aromatic ring-hydroxylating dioxygenase subunit alpha [Kofleriaceae bacterium]